MSCPISVSVAPVAAFALIAGLVLSGSPAVAAPAKASGKNAPHVLAELARIKALTAEAYVWGLAPEFIYRFSNYQELISGPVNTLVYGSYEAAWNNAASNAGDASVLYLSALVDFNKSGGEPLVLTVPPSADQYYVVNLIDAFINGMGSIGTRTTPSTISTHYLLVSPTSPYAHQATTRIGGHEFRVLASDTNVNDILIRVRANSLIAASDPTSVPSVLKNVVHKFALNTLSSFAANDYKPVYPANFDPHVPSDEDVEAAKDFASAPTNADAFFTQVGQALVESRLPDRDTALSNTRVRDLPAWVIPQYGAKKRYFVPAYGQQRTLDKFAEIGLTATGWTQPKHWRSAEIAAFEAGFDDAVDALAEFAASGTASAETNYWSYLNDMIGTYPNTRVGYLVRATVVLEGGFANVPEDAVYPVLSTTDGETPIDGNKTYYFRFTAPADSYSVSELPVEGILPPMVTYDDGPYEGEVKGFWSVIVYQPDDSSSSAPFIPQSTVLNTSYSDAASTSVESISANTLTVNAPAYGPILLSTPLLFGATAGDYGLEPGRVYYVATTPVKTGTTYSFQVSSTWVQELSDGHVPIQQNPAAGGGPGAIATLTSSANPSLTFGLVQPVSQLGSEQIDAGSLATDPDGSITIWLAPTKPDGVAASNWIPTPSTAHYDSIYGPGSGVSTTITAMVRMYYPTPGNLPPSILPYEAGKKSESLPTSYKLPRIVEWP